MEYMETTSPPRAVLRVMSQEPGRWPLAAWAMDETITVIYRAVLGTCGCQALGDSIQEEQRNLPLLPQIQPDDRAIALTSPQARRSREATTTAAPVPFPVGGVS